LKASIAFCLGGWAALKFSCSPEAIITSSSVERPLAIPKLDVPIEYRMLGDEDEVEVSYQVARFGNRDQNKLVRRSIGTNPGPP
jgi:hypothetical protein